MRHVRRREVLPFSDRQIKVLETFADQAVIAIENVRLFNELRESLEQQTAISEILTAIASSPTDIQPVLDAIAESTGRLCNAKDAVIRLVGGNVLRLAAHHGPIPFFGAPEIPINRGSVTGRAIVEGQPVHIEDLLSVAATEFPEILKHGAREGDRTQLAVPLMREGVAIGAILIRRREVDPFTEKQIGLLKTFGDQAVIAIENVRLFKEIQQRNAELREALEHQTATSEVLGIISRSPTDVQPVLDAIVESAARVCGIDDVVLRMREGDVLVARAHELSRSVGELKALGEVGQAVSSTLDLETVLTRIVSHAVQLSGTDGGAIYEYDESSEEFLLRATDHMEEELINALRANPPRLGDGIVGRAAASRQPVQVPNILEERAYAPRMRQMLERYGFRASLAVPLLREGRIVGGLVVRRKSTGEFRPEVVELLKTFATQSVLAIQNARLFREIEDKSRQIEAANRHKSEFLANMAARSWEHCNS